eukprot:gene10823-11975_t
MSLRTRINGFTAWVNLRLSLSTGHLMHNVLIDLLKGYNMKILLESLTGRPFKKIRSFDGLTLAQKETRVEWMMEELKRHEVIPEDVFIDSRMFAMRSAEQVFELLWCLVCHDIWFVWERSEYLQQEDDGALLSKPFTWTPPRPPSEHHLIEKDTSLLSGFGSKSVVTKSDNVDHDSPKDDSPYAMRQSVEERDKEMISRNKMKGSEYPEPDYCILDLINTHLKMTREGCKLERGVLSLDELTDSRVLSALINSFVPETFTSEVLLNDRWTVNLVLWTIAEMFKCSNPFDSEDLVEADIMSVCAYFAFFFMCGYKFKQCRAVVKRLDEMKANKTSIDDEMKRINLDVVTSKSIKRKEELEEILEEISDEVAKIERDFDVPECIAWTNNVDNIRVKTRSIVSQKIKDRYETLTVPRNMTINNLVSSMMINLSLTSGVGFYSLNGKETITKERKLIVKNIETGEFIDDYRGPNKQRDTARSVLRVSKVEVFELNQTDYPQFEIFLDSGSRNKALKAGSKFLYQVFPGNSLQSQRQMYKAAKAGELNIVKKLIGFFEKEHKFVNSRDQNSGNTSLHVACRNGHFAIVLFLLENNADVDCLNKFGITPFFMASEGLHKKIGQLLIEWGADVYKKNRSGKTALDIQRHSELKTYFIEKYKEMNKKLPKIIAGDKATLRTVIREHQLGIATCLNGSTLLHTAAYFGAIDTIKSLLAERVDVNLLDYRGATALHRVKDIDTLEVLLDAGADINIVDDDKNSALHVKCYEESDEPSRLTCISRLMEKRISLTSRNRRGLMPIHCCALQGRIDAIKLLLDFDAEGSIRACLNEEAENPPSLPHLALANDHLAVAQWLYEQSFTFKGKEPDIILEKIIMDKVPCTMFTETINFLIQSGASTNTVYVGGNTPLHLASSQHHMTDILPLLIQYGADVNAYNDDHFTPLFFATSKNNQHGAKFLLDNGADLRLRNYQGLTAFDLIQDYDEWIASGQFDDDILARLKAYSLKQARDLVRAISKRVQQSTGVSSIVNCSYVRRQSEWHLVLAFGYNGNEVTMELAHHSDNIC